LDRRVTIAAANSPLILGGGHRGWPPKYQARDPSRNGGALGHALRSPLPSLPAIGLIFSGTGQSGVAPTLSPQTPSGAPAARARVSGSGGRRPGLRSLFVDRVAGRDGAAAYLLRLFRAYSGLIGGRSIRRVAWVSRIAGLAGFSADAGSNHAKSRCSPCRSGEF
jgi:hypothetical protein